MRRSIRSQKQNDQIILNDILAHLELEMSCIENCQLLPDHTINVHISAQNDQWNFFSLLRRIDEIIHYTQVACHLNNNPVAIANFHESYLTTYPEGNEQTLKHRH